MKNRSSILEAVGTESLKPKVMASSNGLTVEYRATHFGKLINTTCYAMNGATVAACGVGGTGTGSVTIATGTGEGFTTPESFTRVRRFAMGGGSGYVI